MKIELITQTKKSDITELISSITWSGGKDQAARKIDLKIIQSHKDKSIPAVEVNNGNMLRLFDENSRELFQGYIFFKERNSNSEELSLTAFDGLIYLTKSKISKNFKSLTPGGIVKNICSDFSIPIGNIKDTGEKIPLIILDKTGYEAINTAYHPEVLHGKAKAKEYIFRMENGKLNIYEKGSIIVSKTLRSGVNITNSSYSEDIQDMINYVLVTDEQGNVISESKNQNWINSYGRLQDIAKDAVEAKKLLKGVKQSGNIDALGNTECITGNKVRIQDKNSGIVGLFTIESDKHTWSNNQYTMQLTLDFEGVV